MTHVGVYICRNRMTWSRKLELLLANFDLKTKIGSGDEDGKCLLVCGSCVGIIRGDIWHLLRRNCPGLFVCRGSVVEMCLGEGYDARSRTVDQMLRELKEKDVFDTLRGWRDECYDVSVSFGEEPLLKMERSATCLFGIKRCGVHVNGFVPGSGIWVQKRARSKPTWPGKLDNMVSGGFAVGMSVRECVRKEAREEASLTDVMLDNMKPVGTVSFFYEDERGIFPETLFVFDVEVPADFVPTCVDGEVESFTLVSLEELKGVILTDAFKVTSSLVALDFLVRHGHLNSDDEPNYVKLLETLHTPLHFPAPTQ